MLVVPASYQSVKSILIVIISLLWLIDILIKRSIFLHKRIFLLFIIYIFLGSIYGIYGYSNGNLGYSEITKETVGYVIVYMVLIMGLRERKSFELIHQTFILALSFLNIYMIYSLIHALNIIPDSLYIDIFKDTTAANRIDVDSVSVFGVIRMDLSSIPSFMFLYAYLLTQISLAKHRSKLNTTLLIITSFVMIMSGRRILLLLLISMPVILGIILKSVQKQNSVFLKKYFKVNTYILISITVIGVIISSYGYDTNLLRVFFIEGFTSSYYNENIRLETLYYLFNEWKNAPIFGRGSGSVLGLFVRSHSNPWSYELSYMKYLIDYGLFGFTLYGLGILYIWGKGIAILKNEQGVGIHAFALTIGSISFMIGNATNPYLLKFDYLLVLFLPIAVVNYGLLKKHI